MWGFGDSASRRLIVAAAADQHDAVLAEEAGAGPTAVAAAARAAAATGATNALSALLSRRTVTELSMVMPNQHFLDSEVVNAVAQGQHGHRLLLRCGTGRLTRAVPRLPSHLLVPFLIPPSHCPVVPRAVNRQSPLRPAGCTPRHWSCCCGPARRCRPLLATALVST